jgi:hypothetical protein
MTENISAFPPPKPTIADIVMECSKFIITKDYMSDVIVPTVRTHYPDMLPEQLEAAVRAEAIAWNEQLDGEEFWADFETAAALDPDWYETGNHSIGCKPGALHDTPQKLVAAYRAWQDATLPVEDLIKVIMRRATPARAKPGDAERFAGVMMQIVDAHPRRDELLEYGVEQAGRAGLLGKAKRG